MMNHSLKSRCKVSPGTIITGKWHSNKYTVLKELGFGANGIVYLAKFKNTQVALKMSDNGMSITSEVNVLRSFAKVQGSTLGPSLLDVDDWKSNRGQISFYAMEYIQGPDLLTFIQSKGKSWTTVLFLQLLNDLNKLHENGWVFGDLKPENLIVTGPTPKIRCIDVGGTTLQGRAIKEFTEFYDRGYWGLGSRKADPAYDLFAVAMIMINTAYPKRFNKTTGGIAQLREAIRKQKDLLPLEKVIVKALYGQYSNALQMRTELLSLVMDNKNSHPGNKQPVTNPTTSTHQKQKVSQAVSQPKSRQTYRRKKKKSRWFETICITTFITLLYLLYIFQKLL
ncbi:protein kinase family protein [Neobacillus sp. YX16]|uniref:protein kinase domain-containing protein n=1 Tax=Neobacillus sp. YX16 TaxID=3047874 RepID=UPI0024C384D6|nr:protein kinase family protein [Neobacillus sp. YX16]WHZ05870.1 protein kinase family protein [Neobacillus sp. YX16]